MTSEPCNMTKEMYNASTQVIIIMLIDHVAGIGCVHAVAR